MEVGSIREKIIVALLICKFGEKNVETEVPITESEVDVKLFDENVSKRYKLDPKYTRLFRNLMEMKTYVNDSPIRFKRGEKYILSTADYKMKTLDLEKVKRYFNLIKTFI